MTPPILTNEDIKSVIDAAISAKIVLSYPQMALFLLTTALISGVGAYFGTYLKKKGENLATQEDVNALTHAVEMVKTDYSRQLEDYKNELSVRVRAAKIAEFFAEWDAKEPELKKLNQLSMELSLWLPAAIYHKLAECTCNPPGTAGKPSARQVLIEVRQYLLKGDVGLTAEQIVYFPKI